MHQAISDTSEKLTKQATASAPANWLYGPRDVSTRRPRDTTEQRAVGLGWFSIGLGLAQILAPRAVARGIGASDNVLATATMRALGVREIVGGLGILLQPRPNAFLWVRVAGDVVDLALLTQQLTTRRRSGLQLGLAAAAVAVVTALDTKTALDATRAQRGDNLEQDGIHVSHSITINAPPDELYRFWRELENLPKFMAHLTSVEVHGEKSVWRAKAPAGAIVEWEARVTAEEPNTFIAWSSVPGSSVPNHGSVRFVAAPGGRGTELTVELTYEPPGGAVAAVVAKVFGEEPKQQIKSDLGRLKQVIETGEVTQSDASIHRGRHAAQPSAAKPGTLAAVAPPKPTHKAAMHTTHNQATSHHAPTTHGSVDHETTNRGAATHEANPPDNDEPRAASITEMTDQGFGTTRADES